MNWTNWINISPTGDQLYTDCSPILVFKPKFLDLRQLAGEICLRLPSCSPRFEYSATPSKLGSLFNWHFIGQKNVNKNQNCKNKQRQGFGSNKFGHFCRLKIVEKVLKQNIKADSIQTNDLRCRKQFTPLASV